MKRIARRRSAFTLIEVVLVLLIIGLLVGMVAPFLFGMKDKAEVDTARNQIGMFYHACDFYRLGMNDYPSALTQLVEDPGVGSKWAGPYLDGGKVPKDPWSFEYVYEPQPGGAKPRIYSVGRDGQAGTSDDVFLEETQ